MTNQVHMSVTAMMAAVLKNFWRRKRLSKWSVFRRDRHSFPRKKLTNPALRMGLRREDESRTMPIPIGGRRKIRFRARNISKQGGNSKLDFSRGNSQFLPV